MELNLQNSDSHEIGNQLIALLVVDDEKQVLDLVKKRLDRSGDFIVFTANSGESALEIVSDERIDFILMDIKLNNDRNDGISITRELRDRGYRGKICMFSGYFSEEFVFDSALAGADDFIIKGASLFLAEEIKRIYYKDNNEQKGAELSVIKNSAYLRSRLTRDQLDLLWEMVKSRYPSYKELADSLGTTDSAIWKRISRIKEKLEVQSTEEVAELIISLKLLGRK
jgi:two-component system response regulator YesN